jgi:hypothetical protein
MAKISDLGVPSIYGTSGCKICMRPMVAFTVVRTGPH